MAIARLDVLCGGGERRGDMNRTLCSTILIAAAALAGCNKSTENPGANEAQANAANAAAPVTLPPAIAASKIYRCKDNSLVYIDWYSDGSARVKKDRNEVGTVATAEDLKGDATSATVTANGQHCKA
jgi:hypothetical protein